MRNMSVHATSCMCWLIQVDESGQPVVVPTQVALVCPRQQAPRPDQEITIDYGDKSNEQLLLSYGMTAVFCLLACQAELL